jgi:hypothetical protein
MQPIIDVSNISPGIFDLGIPIFTRLVNGVTTHVISATSLIWSTLILVAEYMFTLHPVLLSSSRSSFAKALFYIGHFGVYYFDAFWTTRSHWDLAGWGIFIALSIVVSHSR